MRRPGEIVELAPNVHRPPDCAPTRQLLLPAAIVVAGLGLTAWMYLLALSETGTVGALALAGASVLSTALVVAITVILQAQGRSALAMAEQRTRELAESEARFRAMSDTSPFGVFLSDKAGGVVYTNAAFQRIAGQRPKSTSGWGWGQHVIPEDRAKLVQEREAAVREKRMFDVEVRIMRPDQSLATVHIRADALYEAGNDTRYAGVMEDVTEQRNTEERLRQSEQQFRNLFDSIGDPIVVTDMNRCIVRTNPAFAEAFGYDDGELAGKPTSVLYADESYYVETGARIAANADGAPIRLDARFKRANGEEFEADLRLCFLRDDEGKVLGTIGVVRDVTERRKAEEALRRSEAFANAIFDRSPIAMHVFDENGYSMRMNEAQKELLGLPSTTFGVGDFNVLTNGLFNRVGVSEQFRRAYEGEVLELPGVELEVDPGPDARELGETDFGYDLTLFPLRGETGAVEAVVSFMRDISERKEAESARRLAEQRLALILANLPLAAFAIDKQGTITFAEGKLLHDGSIGNLVGTSVFEYYGESPEVAAQVRRALSGEFVTATFEARGRYFDLRYSPLRGDDGRISGAVGVAVDVTESRLAQRESERMQANLTALIENSDDVIWSVSAKYELLSSNEAFQEMVSHHLGRRIEHGESVFIDDFGDELGGWRELYDRALGGEQFISEMEVRGPRGPRRHEVRMNPVRRPNGTVIGATVFSRDVTERKLSEQALRESEERYRTTFENLYDSFFETNLDDEFIMASPSIKRLHGWTVGEMLGRKSRSLYVDPSRQDALIAELEAGRAVNDFEAELLRKDGSSFPASINAKVIYDDHHRPLAVQGTARDISERKLTEDALRASEARYRATFESLHDVFYQANNEGLITLMSPSCLRHTGYTPDELEGRPIRDLFVHQDQYAAVVSELLERETVNDAEATLRTKSGELVPVSVNATMLRDEAGNFRGAQGTLRDITERKRAEAERDRIFNLTVDMLSVVAAGGTLLRVNPAWEATLGYTAEEIVGTNVWDLLHPDDLAAGRRGARPVDEGKVVTDLRSRFRCKDGSWRWLGWSMTRTSEDGAVYAVARDVTELMETQQEMLRVHAELETMLDAMRENQAVLRAQTEEMNQLRLKAEHLANHDTLTGVANRRAWFAEGTGTKPTAIAIFDIDLFKKVNDTFGHPAGDEVLRQVAARLQSGLPENALLGRLGGEEFAVLFHGSFAEARAACEAAIAAVGTTPVTLEGSVKIDVAVSGGLAPWRPGGRSREESLANTYEEADMALYEAKASGRSRLAVRGPKAA